jgi:single-stranded DNA-binding protein
MNGETTMITAPFDGHLSHDPEITFDGMKNGKQLLAVKISVAHNYWRSGFDGKKGSEETTWLYISAFNGMARRIIERFKKGDFVYGDMSLDNDSYQKQGVTVNTYALTVLNIKGGKLSYATPRHAEDHTSDAPSYERHGSIGGIDDHLP